MKRATLQRMLEAERAGAPVVRAVRLSDGAEALFEAGAHPDTPLSQAAAQALSRDRSGAAEVDGARWFFQVVNAPFHLIVVGAVHVTAALLPMAAELGYRVTVIDPRTAFAAPERFPGQTILTGWPDEEMARLTMHARTAIVTLTHDPKLDDPALIAALRSQAIYIGALGSRKTHAARVERLKQHGFAASEIVRIHAPVGLDIGALSPAEIGLSVLAQIVAVMRGAGRP